MYALNVIKECLNIFENARNIQINKHLSTFLRLMFQKRININTILPFINIRCTFPYSLKFIVFGFKFLSSHIMVVDMYCLYKYIAV